MIMEGSASSVCCLENVSFEIWNKTGRLISSIYKLDRTQNQ